MGPARPRVLTGPSDHTVLVRQGALHERLAVLVPTAHVAVQGPGWGEAQAISLGWGWGCVPSGLLRGLLSSPLQKFPQSSGKV